METGENCRISQRIQNLEGGMAGLKASRPFFQPWQTQADAVGQLVGSGLSHYAEN